MLIFNIIFVVMGCYQMLGDDAFQRGAGYTLVLWSVTDIIKELMEYSYKKE